MSDWDIWEGLSSSSGSLFPPYLDCYGFPLYFLFDLFSSLFLIFPFGSFSKIFFLCTIFLIHDMCIDFLISYSCFLFCLWVTCNDYLKFFFRYVISLRSLGLMHRCVHLGHYISLLIHMFCVSEVAFVLLGCWLSVWVLEGWFLLIEVFFLEIPIWGLIG